MPKPIVEIKDFSSGMTQDPSRPAGFATLFGCDIHSVAGELNISPPLEADSDAIFTTNSDFMLWMEPYDANGGTSELYGYGDEGILYRRTAGAWAEIRDVAATVLSEGQGLKAFGDSLYYTTRTTLGQLQGDPTVGGNYDNSLQTLSEANPTNGIAPMVVFGGALYVGSGRYIDKLEASELVWNAEVLTLPKNYRISAMAVWNDKIVITTNSTTRVAEEQVYFWDGISEFWDLAIGIPFGGDALFDFNNILLLFINNVIYSFTGSDFTPFVQIPKRGTDLGTPRSTRTTAGGMDIYKDRLVFSMFQGSVGSDTQFLSGIYSIGRRSSNQPMSISYEFLLSTGGTAEMNIGAVKTFGTINDVTPFLYVSYRDIENTAFVTDISNPDSSTATGAYMVTPAYEISDDDEGRLVKGTRIEFNGDMATNDAVNKVDVYYRKDEDINYEDDTTNFTFLGTIDNDAGEFNNQKDILYGVYKKANRIQFKYVFTANGSTPVNNMKIRRILIY